MSCRSNRSNGPQRPNRSNAPGVRRCLALAWSLLTASAASAGAPTPIGPFDGDAGDPLNYPFTLIAASIDIFGGAGRLHSFNDQATAIHLLFSSQFAGDLVSPHTGGRVLGFTSGPGIFEFDTPVHRFGAWWNNNGGVDGAMVEFLDADGEVFATTTAVNLAPGNIWTWNGWESTTPIASIRVTGLGTLNGLQWFDDLQIAYSALRCAADLTGDDLVDGDDLGVLLGAWGSSSVGDINGDGATDGADLAALIAEWGTCQ